MKERKEITKYLLPVALVMVMAVALVAGIVFMRNSLMKLTVEERSSQLKEMVTQIRANLYSGFQIHWNLVAGLNNAHREVISGTVRMCLILLPIWKMISALISMDAG